MRRWTKIGLCLLALGLIAAPVSAQKLLCDVQIIYNMYSHNYQTLHNGMDVGGGGTYVYLIPHIFGTPDLGDNIRKCWSDYYLRGGQESLGGPDWTSWSFTICGTTNVVSGLQTFFTVADTGTGADFCIAPFGAGNYFLLNGYFAGANNYGLPGGCWIFVFFFAAQVGFGAPLPFLAFATLNNGLCLSGSMIYELQHGYNASALNQVYLALISVDEIGYANAGGISEGDSTYGSADWGGIVNNGGLVSYTRMINAPRPPFGGGNFGILLFPGQSGYATGDGLDSYQSMGFTETANQLGRNNGIADGAGAIHPMYGQGGNDWVSCNTSNGLNDNTWQQRALDYAYGQFNTGSAVACATGQDYRVEWFWSCSAPVPCVTNSQGAGGATPYDGSVNPLDYGIPFDFWTNIFNTNPKAVANVKFSQAFTPVAAGGATVGFLIFDAAWPAWPVDPVIMGHADQLRGDQLLLQMCHPKAINNLTPANGPFFLQALVQDPGGANFETSNVAQANIF